MDIFNVFLVATVEGAEKFDYDEFFESLGLSLYEPNAGIFSFSSPEPGSGSRTCNVCFCRLDMRNFASSLEYVEAISKSVDGCCDWLEERSEAIVATQERMRYTLFVEMFLSNRYGFTFPPAFVRVCAELNLTLDFDLYPCL